MRAALVPILGVFVSLGMGLNGAAQERLAFERSAVRVSSQAVSSTSQPIQSSVLGFVVNAPTVVREGRRPSGNTYSIARAQVRAILGIPGAAMLSTPLALPAGIENVYFAPRQNYALAEQSTGTVALLQFSGTQSGSIIAVPGTLHKPDLVTFSPNGLSAAIFSAEEGHLLVFTGLPNSPQLSRDLSGGDLPAGIKTLALADDGATLLAGTSDSRVLVLRSGSAAQLAYSATDLAGIAFAPASTDALLFDHEGAKALLLQNVATAPSPRMLAEGLAGLSGAIVLEVDNGSALVGAVNAKSLSRIDLQTLRVDSITLAAGLTTLRPLGISHRFLLSAQPGQAAWILDTSSDASAVYFVPPQRIAMATR